MMSACQRCGHATYHWNVRQTEFHVGRIDHWKVQLCDHCTTHVEHALLVLLRSDLVTGLTPSADAVDPVGWAGQKDATRG